MARTPDPRTAAAWPYFAREADRPVVLAHQGGAFDPDNVGIPNTLAAFRHAVHDLGVTHIETDVRATADGVAVIIHDETLDGLTDGFGPVAEYTLADLERLRVGGRDPIPTLAEALAAFPDTFFNVDLKVDEVLEPALAAITETGAQGRVCIASFSERRIRRAVRSSQERFACSHSRLGILLVVLSPSWRWLRPLVRALAGPGAALQVPEMRGPFRVVSARSVRRAHALGKQVQVWTVDEESDMRRLIALGVDGLVTDRPDVAVRMLGDGPGAQPLDAPESG
jgi:glycerophosphoryl diester phosphodiesterase